MYEGCIQEDPITETGQSIGRCKIPNTANPAYVPIYVPKNKCPDPINTNPRRFELVCKSNPSRSLPLSNEEYLRKKMSNGNSPLSNSYLLQTNANTGIYRTTTWTQAGNKYDESIYDGFNLKSVQSLAPPVTGTGGRALDAGTLTQIRMAIAGRGSFSPHDKNGKRYDSITSLRRMGLAIMSNPGNTQPCIPCDLSGTSLSVVIGQHTCTCDGNLYTTKTGPFGFLWEKYSNGSTYASPAISADGRLMYIGTTNEVWALEIETGSIIWKFNNPYIDDDYFYSNIAIGSNGTIYFGGLSQYFFAVDGLRGTIKWSFDSLNSNNFFSGKPCFNISETLVYITSNGPNAAVYAFSTDGGVEYIYPNSGSPNPDLNNNDTLQSPSVGPDGSVYLVYNETLVALTETLDFKWMADCGTCSTQYSANNYSPVIDSTGLIYVGSDDETSKLYCFIDDGNDFTLKWTYESDDDAYILSPVIGNDNQVYVCVNVSLTNSPSFLLSLSPVNGNVIWSYENISVNPFNWVLAGLGLDNTLYITNINDSSLVVLKDRGSNFQNVNTLYNPSSTSIVYGSLTLSPPVAGPTGSVYWCNSNSDSPSIFGAGFPTYIVYNKDETDVAPVFRPRFAPRITPSASITEENKIPLPTNQLKSLARR